ncbi:hypothetical protein [Lunatimonas lonarensis]|nr:hypothetical protein [Lunatimonas lonarensis]
MVWLKSLNPLFEPYAVAAGEVLEKGKFHAYTSRQIPKPETDLQKLVRAVRDMQQVVSGWKEG